MTISETVPIVLLRDPTRPRQIVAEALRQEGVPFALIAPGELKTLGATGSAQRLVIVDAPIERPERDALRGWVSSGGKVVVTEIAGWSDAELADWFGIRPIGFTTRGGYLIPAGPELATPAFNDLLLQIHGERRLFKTIPGAGTEVVAQSTPTPSAAVALDASGDGFCDNQWFWAGPSVTRYYQGKTEIAPFTIESRSVVPNAAAAGDFTGRGKLNGIAIASGADYFVSNDAGVNWTAHALDQPIRHILSFPTASPVWGLSFFLSDGSIFRTSLDGGATFGPPQVFAPGGQPVATDFSYSYDYVDSGGVIRSAANVFANGIFYYNFGAGWGAEPVVPDLGPKYLFSNIMRPTIGYAADPIRKGYREEIDIFVNSNLYVRDFASGRFNSALQFNRVYEGDGEAARRWPGIVRRAGATAFLFDFDETIVRLQQGDVITNAEHERLIALLGPTVAFTPIINAFDDLVDYTNLFRPQADLHEKLLRIEIASSLAMPLPRLSYLPNGYRSAVSLSHDVELANPMRSAFEIPVVRACTLQLADLSTRNGRRDSFFLLMTESGDQILSRADIDGLKAAHYVTIHFDTFGSTDFTAQSLAAQSDVLRQKGVTVMDGTRSHGLAYLEEYLPEAISAQPELELLDSTFGGGPGYCHSGSNLPYQLYKLDGSPFEPLREIAGGLMDIADAVFYVVRRAQAALAAQVAATAPHAAGHIQRMDATDLLSLAIATTPAAPQHVHLRRALTHLSESSIDEVFEHARKLVLDNDTAYNGVFDASFHPCVVAGLVPPVPPFMDRIVAFMKFLDEHRIPCMTLDDVAKWWAARARVSIANVEWTDANVLQATVRTDVALPGVTLLIPSEWRTLRATSVSVDGKRVKLVTGKFDATDYVTVVFDLAKEAAVAIAFAPAPGGGSSAKKTARPR